MRTYTKVPNKTKQSKRIGDLTPRCWFVRVIRMFRPNAERDLVDQESCGKFNYCVCLCVVCVCMCVLCVRDMYIQWCRHAPEHTHTHILMQSCFIANAHVCGTNMSKPLKLWERGHVACQIPGNARRHTRKKKRRIPLGQKRLQMAHEPRGVCFKLWVIKSCSSFLHSPRSHVGDVLWNSEQTHVANSHDALGQLSWIPGKCVFDEKMQFCDIQNTPRKGPIFGQLSDGLDFFNFRVVAALRGWEQTKMRY